MQTISDSVGYQGKNKKSDVALVQAILLKTACLPGGNESQSKTYLASYEGEYGKSTEDALRSFQGDYVNVSPDGRQCMQNPDATDALVKPGDATWKKLLERVDRAFADMRVLDGGRTVYLAGPAQQLADSLAAAGARTFAPNFRPKVIACIHQMQIKHGIVLSVCPQGDRRTFQQQHDVWLKNHSATHAGPGESNHNFGMAVDLGFQHLRWLKKDGTVVEERSWYLESLKEGQGGAEEARFWQVFRALGTAEVGLFRGPVDDLDHLQNWDDRGVDMASRLADLLTRVGAMKWRGRHQTYSCDFGLGGDFYPVGTARQIWSYQGAVTVANLTQARAAEQRRRGAGTQRAGVGGGGATVAVRPVVVQAVTADDVTAMQKNLRSDFEAADVSWQEWTAR